VDEISTKEEVEAARTISQRGVRLVATVHGVTLPELINCNERSMLVGGQHSVTLGEAAAAKRADKRKTVSKRLREPVFTEALELHAREKWFYHPSVVSAVDSYMEGEPCDAEELTPGKATAVAAVPRDGGFDYCLECGLGDPCAQHRAEPSARAGGYMQRSGACHSCGQPGHFSRNCTWRGGGFS